MNKKKIYLLLGILMLIVSLVGSYAYFSWKTNESRLVLTVGDVESIQVVLKPYKIDTEIIPVLSYDNEEYVNVDAINKSNNSKKFELYYHVNSIDSKLKNNNFKYTITKSTDGGNTYTEIKTDNFEEVDNNTDLVIYSEKVDGKSTIKYKVYVWLSSSGDQSDISGSEFNAELRARFDSSDNIVVDVPDGMIPIVFDTSNGTVVKTISSDDSSWYDYTNQLWANAVLVTSSSRSNYLGTTGVTVNESDILAYYTYIPRYKYKIWTTGLSSTGQEQSIDIQFESANMAKSTGTTVGSYLTHPAFTFGDTELNGIWVGKFETTGTADEPTVLPDVSSLRNQNVSTQFKTALKFSGGNLLSNGNVSFSGNNTYGLTVKANTHMMKNSEWGAVAYLSHSIYGVNREVYINNSAGFYTGRSNGNLSNYPTQTSMKQSNSSIQTTAYIVDSNQQLDTHIKPMVACIYQDYGFYTWDGYLLENCSNIKTTTRDLSKVASTTGNITGVYDMSGGATEYVMGYFSPASSTWGASSEDNYAGFSNKINSKYYDDYTTTDVLTACNGEVCYGHALSETNNWYDDYAYFLDDNNKVWFLHSGNFENGINAGIFYFYTTDGSANSYRGFRSVVITDPNGKTITSPTITIGTNGNSGYVSGNISSTITVDKGSSDLDTSTYKYIYSTSNSTVPTTSFTSGNSYTLEGATGTYYLIAKACDVDGVCTTKVSNPFYVDNTAPTGTISVVANNENVVATVNATDSGIGVIKDYGYLIQKDNTTCPSSGYTVSSNDNYTFTLSENGTYTICVKISDSLNNSNIISNTITASDVKLTYTQIANNYSCANSSTGSNPIFTYTGNCEVVDDENDNWKIRFLTSGDLTFTKDINIDVFLVGGGGSGSMVYGGAGGGGGGGYTKTATTSIDKSTSYPIVIGDGGTALTNVYSGSGKAGGSSTAFSFSASGGSGGSGNSGGAGGSGGGAGGYQRYGGSGGTNGGSGAEATYAGLGSSTTGTVGQGQGTSTREFYEIDKDDSAILYAGGGGGGACGYNSTNTSQLTAGAAGDSTAGKGTVCNFSGKSTGATSGVANTGGGGGAGATTSWYGSSTDTYKGNSGAGGSGIVIIRNKR